MGKKHGSKGELFFYGLMMLAGLAVAVWGASLIYRACVSLSWPSCPGQVVSSQVKDTSHRVRDGVSGQVLSINFGQ